MVLSIRAFANARRAPLGLARSLPESAPRLVLEARRAELALAVMASALLTAIWVWPPAYLAFTVDDSFYYLEAARNLAAGLGWTFDRIETTDGYHPLWLYVLAGLCRALEAMGVSSPATLMRSILSLQVLLVGVSVGWLGRVRELSLSSAPGWLAALLLAFYGAKVLINGQESALQLALIALALGVFARSQERGGSTRCALELGVLTGLCALARLEAALFGLATAGVVVWQGPGGATRRLRHASLLLAAFALVFAPYVLHHYLSTGHVMPVSGAIKAGETGYLPPLLRGILAAALAACALWFTRASLQLPLLRQLLPLLAYVLGLEIYLILARGELLPSIWYCAPHLLLAVILLARVLPGERLQQASPRRLALAGLGFAAVVLPMWMYRVQPSSYVRYAVAADIGRWLDRHVSPDARVASWDAGIIGAHTERLLTNLDGLVNSWEYKLQYLDTRKTDQYMRERGVTHLVQYLPLAHLKSGPPQWRGVQLGSWRVADARCFDVRRISSFWRSDREVFLVLAREGQQPELAAWLRSNACRA